MPNDTQILNKHYLFLVVISYKHLNIHQYIIKKLHNVIPTRASVSNELHLEHHDLMQFPACTSWTVNISDDCNYQILLFRNFEMNCL